MCKRFIEREKKLKGNGEGAGGDRAEHTGPTSVKKGGEGRPYTETLC